MSNGYKAPSGLGSAVRGRSMVTRDYTKGVRFKAGEREAKGQALRSTLGIVQGIASGAADYAQTIESNIKSHDLAEAGAKAIFESSGMEGDFEQSGYKGATGIADRWFKQAKEISDTQVIGDKEFSVEDLYQVGTFDRVKAVHELADPIYDEFGNKTGAKSLYESLGSNIESSVGGITQTTESKAPEITQPKGDERFFRYRQSDADGTQTVKNNVVEQQKQNVVGGQPPEPTVTTEPWKAELDKFFESYEEYGGENVNQFIEENPQFADYKKWQSDYDKWFKEN